MNRIKKLSIRIFIVLYSLSYFLQNSFFIDRRKVYAAETPSTTNIVAIFVDKEIYEGIKANLVRYTSKYIQKKIANSKVVVFPIDTTKMKAHEISQMLENMYFEGLKDQSSKLVGTVLIGDIPLPVVENNGFIYPSIFPYVDFEDQEFVYDTNKKFFVYNNNPNGQAELRHGIIKFDTVPEYNTFFNKVKNYYNNPTTFIDKAIWYEDFIGLKKYFIPENTKYYINNLIFSEDIGYHRFNNLLLNTLTDEHNKSVLNIGNDLSDSLKDVTDPELKAYGEDMKVRNDNAATITDQISSSMPTLTLKTATQEMLKGYDGLISSQFLSKIKDNVAGLARRYKTTNGETFTDYSSLTDKIAQKDNRLLGDLDNEVQPLLIQMNDFLEKGLNEKIEEEKYYMTIPIPVSELDFEGDMKRMLQTFPKLPKRICVWNTYNYYENYFFGKNANIITSAEDTSIYKGTYQNLTTLSGQNNTNTNKSIGGSYQVFSTQIEANRGYDFNSTKEELDKYAKYKTNKQSLRQLKCNSRKFLGLWCMGKTVWTKNDTADENKCDTNDPEKQGGCESMSEFATRNRGGASPMNINTTTQKLTNYNYKNAVLPIYNIAGAKKIDSAQPDANSYSGAITYTTMIQKKFGVKDIQNGGNTLTALLANPIRNGSDLIFTNQLPVGNLENPTRIAIPPKTYAQTDFFTLFNGLSHTTYGGKTVLYNRIAPTDAKNCNARGNIYTYKTIDSRVKNISPTWDQISSTDFYKFSGSSDLNIFYTKVITELSGTQTNIIEKKDEIDTNIIPSLSELKNIIASGNDGIQNILTFIPAVLLTMSPADIAAKAKERSGTNLTPEKITEITGKIENINEGLDGLLNYINVLNINTVQSLFTNIIQSENLKNQKVEILDTWKTAINQNLDGIPTKITTLKSSFANARGIYNAIENINDNAAIIATIDIKKGLINALDISCLPNLCGCDANHYKQLCDVLDNLKAALTIGTGINKQIDEISQYEENNITTQPFIEINQKFTSAPISTEVGQIKLTMNGNNLINGFLVSTDPNKKETNKGMNLTTQDRPIDNIRNITFQGIGGDQVKFNYPNLYEVKIYTSSGNKLLLKTPSEIREAIKTYLTGKVAEYNILLTQQKQKKDNGYYSSKAAQFNYLGLLDPLANPNSSIHNYDIIDENYFIDKLTAFLDTLKNSPEYGKKAIYGLSASDTTDEKLDMIAKLLYYQNITWPERLTQDTVEQDIAETKNSFDINQKINYVTNTYLTQGNDQGKFITPTYNSTGYEVGYINLNGEDYISTKSVPAFVQQIQTAQKTVSAILPPPANAFIEAAGSSLEDEVNGCEGVDTQGMALLVELNPLSSPWLKAMKCRAKTILKQPLDRIKISFKNTEGPVFLGVLKEIGNSLENYETQWKEYGAARSAPNNDDIINQAEGETQQKLQGYNNNAIIKIDETIIQADGTGSNKIRMGMMQDMGNIKVKISGTGDNCFGINRNGTILSENICTKTASEFYNPNKEEYIFDIISKQKKAGTTALKMELCPSNGNLCITKQQVITTMPGPIQDIQIKTATNIVMEGGSIPILVSATDEYGNAIGQSIQSYTISVQSGDGKIYDGTTTATSITFDNFDKANFIYQAPTNIKDNKGIVISITPNQTEQALGAKILLETKGNPTQLDKGIFAQKNITVVKGIVTVLHNNIVLQQTNILQKTQQKILFNLPKNEADIQYIDTDGTPQINPQNIASIILTIKDKNGNRLDTVANIISKEGLLQPGTIKEKSITKNNGTKKQYIFSKANDFIIKDGQLEITLYPSFKAGNDTIIINIPGITPITIPITVNSGPAKTVLMKLEKSRIDLTVTQESKGTIQVVDTRNNKVTQPTTIKLGTIGAATTNISEFNYNGKEYTYTITAKKPGGEGYVFAYIKNRELSDQMPAYERFIVQENILPKEKLNVMYLNLFGTDRGNQRGYFSENNKVVNTITNKSNKLLATTTQLVDPNKIKQIEYIISPHAQIQSINNIISTLTIRNKEFLALMPEIAEVNLGTTNSFKIKVVDSGTVNTFEKNENTLLYIPEPTDSVITSNKATNSKITINTTDILDLNEGSIDPNIIITADNETLADMSRYTMTFDGKTIGKLLIRNNGNITSDTTNINILSPIIYGQTSIFTEGSTNTQGIGIYIQTSTFTKQGYKSIEDSSDAMLGIGFTNDFKNVSNFANGKSVGEATLPYGSQFLINFGDPLLERRDKNPNIPDTDFDASIGQTIYADPNKTIFKVLPIDFNNDGLKDLIVVYTDGVIRLVKNYGGTNPYQNLQELMIIAEPIKDIKIGDVDGNGYEDIFVITNNNKGIVYLNNEGIFPVDGKNVCLNVNAEPGMINPTPDDFSDIEQIFVKDMDIDGKLDVVTNDAFGDIKIFYGGSTNKGANYISSVTGTCDENRYTRQKNNYKTIKRFGVKVNSSRYIQDESLIHRKGTVMPTEGIEEEKDVETPDTTAGMTKAQMETLKDESMNKIKDMVANNDSLIASGADQLAYTDNPLTTSPIYESLSSEKISYLPINESNDAVSVYKEYEDMNGGVMRDGDEIVIKTTIISKKNNNKLTYIDKLQGPRTIVKDDENKISSLVFTTNNTGGLVVDRNAPEGYQFVIDNIQLDAGAMLSFSYRVRYKQEKPIIKIDVKDDDILKQNIYKDTYPDIIVNVADTCQKNRRVFNEKPENKRTYNQVYDDIQKEINQYNNGAQNNQVSAINGMIDQIANTTSLESIASLPGMDNLEKRSTKNIINSLFQPGGLSLNINTSFIDNATAKVSKKLDTALQGLCQGFKLGNGSTAGCGGVPVPFNQAFLAPGDYHVFGCVPKETSPLYPIFNTLNTSIGKGMPLLTFPGNRWPILGAYLPIPGIFGFPFKGPTDNFFLGLKGGPYSSVFRLYIVPTLTLGLGMAMCFGPYTVGKAIPKPARDLLGNCIVFALPPLTTCGNTNGTGTVGQPTTESLGSSMINAADQGTCNNPPKLGNTIVFAGETTENNTTNTNGEETLVTTANFPFQIVSAGSSANNPPYSAAIPQGNFGGLVVMDQDPIKISASEDYGNATEQLQQGTNYEGYDLKKGPKIDLKVLGAKTKGLVKCVVQDRTTRQIQYIQNNLTKMTIQLDLPDMGTIFQGFDKIGNLQETYASINQEDKAAGYIQSTSGKGIGSGANRTDKLSKQELENISEKVGENPFEAIQEIFKEVPLINIDSKDINIKIPALTSDDINTYGNYLKLWIEKNSKILEDWTDMINQTLALCGTTDKAEAQKTKDSLLAEQAKINDNTIKGLLNGEIKRMQAIIDLTGNENKTRQQMGSDVKNIGINLDHTITTVATLPLWIAIETKLLAIKAGEGTDFKNTDLLNIATTKIKNLQQCSNIVGGMDKFLTFKENTAGLIKSVKANINVLEKYKEFPEQLYQWTHITDRYLTEVSSLLSDFVGSLTYWLNTNANRFSQYVDAITLIVGAIKTWQAIIDFSVNRSEKCSKCSNDNYGSFSCSLSFLCPKLPIFPIPAFKIPNIYMDMSHIELGMNIVLPKINFIPLKISLPEIPNLPEPPEMEININVNFMEGLSLPTIPIIPGPPSLPEPPSFIPSIKLDLPILPPAPKIPKMLPEISAIIKVADFIGKIFCIVKGSIGLVGEKGVKGKIEQITQRTWNVPVFDYFNLTTKFKDPPLQGFDYKLDAYATLKFNFDGVYDVFNTIASFTNNFMVEAANTIEAPIKKAIDRTQNKLDVTGVTSGYQRLIDSGFNFIENLDQNTNVNININGYLPKQETGEMMEYKTAYTELKQGLIEFKNSTLSDKTMNNRVRMILATVENKSKILPATDQIQQVEQAAKSIINDKIKENQTIQKEIKDYDIFIKKLKNNQVVLVDDKTLSANLTTPILTIDSTTKNILQTQEDPTKTYLNLNKKMVQGYLDAVNNDGPEKLNMSTTTYKKSKKYLETTKEKIDTALLAYNDTPLLAQSTCTNCSSNEETNNYSTDISAYVNGVFIEAYSGDSNSSGSTKNMVNTLVSTDQIQKVQKTYTTDIDLNNDKKSDILMYDSNTIYVKYAQQESEHFSKGNNSLATYYSKFYSYESEHAKNIFNTTNRYISSLEQVKNNSDAYGYMKINDIMIKVVDKNKEVKNFKTNGQTFDNLKLSRTNSKMNGEEVDGYIIKVSNKIDSKDTPSSFREFLGIGARERPKYILVLPKNTDYKKSLLTIDENFVKKPINLELGDNILAVEYYEPTQKNISVTFKELPRKRLYTSLATLEINKEDLSTSQNKSFILYKKTSPRSNQTVAGMQNLGDNSAPVGEITLWRDKIEETISTGVTHEGYINTNYTLKSLWTDNVVVKKMIIQQDGQTIFEKNNDTQTGTINLSGLFFTGITQQSFDFIAIDQNNNIAKETVTLNIKIPDIEVIDVKKNVEAAEIVAKISNDLDEGLVVFQRLRNGLRKNIDGTNQTGAGGFELSPKQTVITGGIFTMGNEVGLYDNQSNEIATIDPKTGEIKINQGYQKTVTTYLNFNTHIPIVELRDTVKNITLFQIVLPVEAITNIKMNANKPDYEQLQLPDRQFGDFNNGYCIKNSKNDCILYTNNAGAIYIPGMYASSLVGEYIFDKTTNTTTFVIKDQSNKPIVTLTLKIKSNK